MIEQSDLGRIVVPRSLPSGKALFYTTLDFDGAISDGLTRLLVQRFGIDAALYTCNQGHGVNVRRVVNEGRPEAGTTPCDALWTDLPHVALGIKIADCLPVTLIDGETIVNIHSGWRGTAQGITAATLDTLERESSFDSTKAFAYLGPSIRVCCFEVGEEVAERFPSGFLDRSQAKPHVDIAALTVALLQERGFAPARIFDSGLCTRCDGSIFHSFRRDGKGGGRNLAIVA